MDVELSEYAGYAGFIAANGGLAPNENSVFFKKYGFKVAIRLSEEESWPALNTGKMAASATTADVLAIYGKQFQMIVPAQIGYSRGADGVVVRSEIKRINDLKGKILATSQFTEADFFIRYLAQEAGHGNQHAAGFEDLAGSGQVESDLLQGRVRGGRFIFARCEGRRQHARGLRDVGPEDDGGGRWQRRQGARVHHDQKPAGRRGYFHREQGFRAAKSRRWWRVWWTV